MTIDSCNDNRYELIEKYKQKLIEATNIETSTDEMAVIDNVLFRFWQMGWLNLLEKSVSKKTIETDKYYKGCCPTCKTYIDMRTEWMQFDCCPHCGQSIDWSDEE